MLIDPVEVLWHPDVHPWVRGGGAPHAPGGDAGLNPGPSALAALQGAAAVALGGERASVSRAKGWRGKHQALRDWRPACKAIAICFIIFMVLTRGYTQFLNKIKSWFSHAQNNADGTWASLCEIAFWWSRTTTMSVSIKREPKRSSTSHVR